MSGIIKFVLFKWIQKKQPTPADVFWIFCPLSAHSNTHIHMLPLECVESNSQLVVLVYDQSYYLFFWYGFLIIVATLAQSVKEQLIIVLW